MPALYKDVVRTENYACGSCGGEVIERFDDKATEAEMRRTYLSKRHSSSLRKAVKEIASDDLDMSALDGKFFTVGYLSRLIGEQSATTFLTLLQRFIQTADQLAADTPRCEVCEGPAQEIFAADGSPLGYRQTPPSTELAELMLKVLDFKAELLPEYLALDDHKEHVEVYLRNRDFEHVFKPEAGPQSLIHSGLLDYALYHDDASGIRYRLRELWISVGLSDPYHF